jgi:hypothetical protein
MDPRRVDAIREWKHHPPRTYRDIQIFIGFCNFYRRFIYAFSRIAKPIQDLLRGMKNGRKPGLIGSNWQGAQQKAFEGLIGKFATAPSDSKPILHARHCGGIIGYIIIYNKLFYTPQSIHLQLSGFW